MNKLLMFYSFSYNQEALGFRKLKLWDSGSCWAMSHVGEELSVLEIEKVQSPASEFSLVDLDIKVKVDRLSPGLILCKRIKGFLQVCLWKLLKCATPLFPLVFASFSMNGDLIAVCSCISPSFDLWGRCLLCGIFEANWAWPGRCRKEVEHEKT